MRQSPMEGWFPQDFRRDLASAGNGLAFERWSFCALDPKHGHRLVNAHLHVYRFVLQLTATGCLIPVVLLSACRKTYMAMPAMPAGVKPASSSRKVLQVHRQSTRTPVCMWAWSAGPCPADLKETKTASIIFKTDQHRHVTKMQLFAERKVFLTIACWLITCWLTSILLQIPCNLRSRPLVRDLPTQR